MESIAYLSENSYYLEEELIRLEKAKEAQENLKSEMQREDRLFLEIEEKKKQTSKSLEIFGEGISSAICCKGFNEAVKCLISDSSDRLQTSQLNRGSDYIYEEQKSIDRSIQNIQDEIDTIRAKLENLKFAGY